LDLVNDATQLTVPEAARRLGLPGDDVYRLIFRGTLPGRPSEDGAVYVSSSAVDEYKAKLVAERVIEA
jgi:excisionase family DNA binding protein